MLTFDHRPLGGHQTGVCMFSCVCKCELLFVTVVFWLTSELSRVDPETLTTYQLRMALAPLQSCIGLSGRMNKWKLWCLFQQSRAKVIVLWFHSLLCLYPVCQLLSLSTQMKHCHLYWFVIKKEVVSRQHYSSLLIISQRASVESRMDLATYFYTVKTLFCLQGL